MPRAPSALALALALVYALALAAFGPRDAAAHPLSFGLLEARARGRTAGRYDVRFRFSGTEQQAVGVTPAWPAHCRVDSPVQRDDVHEGGESQRFELECGARGLAGARVALRGMEHTGVQVLVRVVLADGATHEAMLGDARREWLVPSVPERTGVARAYLRLGVAHIATGADHLLFVLGVLLLASTRRRVLLAVSAFTLGHSVTLALAALGLVRPAAAGVEALIALSILAVAVEAARPSDAPPTLSRRYPWAVAGAFGLLHGFGFAGALAGVGLPRGEVARALLAFNAGVEAGQLAFVALCALAARALPVRLVRRAAPYAIGVPAAYWCLERAAAFLSTT